MKNNYVSYNGILKVNGVNLVNQYDEVIILKGISTHGIQWYGNLANKSMLESLKNKLNINAIRIAMYTAEKGYIFNKNYKYKVSEIVQYCLELDLYVIIDWHILRDSNPNIYKQEAIAFFDEMSKTYKNCANIIYEICNEPNGKTTWKNDIKPYSEKVISIIRCNSPDSIIIVGTEKYSQRIGIAADDPLDFENILYALHFYSGTHREDLRSKFIYARNKGLPIIVSEFGVCDAETNCYLDLEEARIWLDLLKRNNISIFNWALSDKNEASSLLNPGANVQEIVSDSLSVSGNFIQEQYKKY